MRSSKTRGRYSRVQSFTVAIYLIGLVSACALLSSDPVTDVCPPPQWMDDKVAEELEGVPFEGHEDFWSWVSRIERLNEALEACHN